ncbi:MAG: hypothetical protein MUE81_05855 [Thermoflexibacter sp.]|jgi:hypothetical protein|nr:hypothetical protein [Thermoflexibacter sp.]
MKLFSIFLCLFFLTFLGQAQSRWSADFAVGTHGIGTPFHNAPISQGGMMFTSELHRNVGGLEDKSYFKLGLNISWYNHKNMKNAILIMPMISCRLGIGSMFVEPSLALGYAGSVLRQQTFSSDGNGNYKAHKNKWLSGFSVQPRLRLGARIHAQFDVYTQYAFQVEGLYNAMPVMPWQSLQIGTTYRFK